LKDAIAVADKNKENRKRGMLMNSTNKPHFLVKSDGTFKALLGDVLLKAEKVGDTEGYHFVGTASTPDKDREGEKLLQKGLNFEPFMDHGEYNWNHVPHAMVGLPVGKKAWFDDGLWRCEGMILKGMPIWDGYDTDMVVKQHNQLRKAGLPRGLCCSVEGKVTKRSDDGKYVEKADIFNIALTFRPVNPSCTISMLAKSLDHKLQIEVAEDEVYKALSTTQTGSFTKEDLEGHGANSIEGRLEKHLISKGYKPSEARQHVAKFMKKKFSGKGA